MQRILIIMFAVSLMAFLTGCAKKQADRNISKQEFEQHTNNLQNKEIEEGREISLPQGEDLVRLFFNLINDKKIPEAIAILNPALYPDESSKQAYGVQFNIFDSISVKSIELANFGDEKESEMTYKVMLDVKIRPGSASAAPMPDYGWENGDNIRWICLEKISDVWKISCISTGP